MKSRRARCSSSAASSAAHRSALYSTTETFSGGVPNSRVVRTALSLRKDLYPNERINGMWFQIACALNEPVDPEYSATRGKLAAIGYPADSDAYLVECERHGAAGVQRAEVIAAVDAGRKLLEVRCSYSATG